MLVAAVVMALLQIAVPLTDDRAVLTTAVVVAFAATTTLLVAGTWGGGRAVLAAAVVVGGTLVLEAVATRTGWPFGEYDYSDDLRPAVAGVPVAVALAWWAMAVPAREVAARLVPAGWQRVALGAAALTAWDVFLDPQMVDEGYWTWAGGGPWRDVPISNYVGWFLASAVVMVVLDRLLPRRGDQTALLALYSWWAVLSTLGFLVFFGDPLVGVVGGLCMLPLAGLAWREELRA